MTTTIARNLIEEYLMRLCFGDGCDFLALAVARAYREMAPTLRRLPGREAVPRQVAEEGQGWVTARLDALRGEGIGTQTEFDRWHRAACEALTTWHAGRNRVDFTIGQAQKWINTALVFGIILREERVPGFGRLHAYYHLPLDTMTIKALCRYDCPRLPVRWSRMRDYEEYFQIQQWARDNFAGFESLMEVFFLLWQGRTECLLPQG